MQILGNILKLVSVNGELRLNGWLKYKAEREALAAKEAKKAEVTAARMAAREEPRAAKLELQRQTKALERAAKREARELRMKEREAEQTYRQTVQLQKIEPEPDLLMLASEGHLPGFKAVNPHAAEPEISYTDWLESRYVLCLPEGVVLKELAEFSFAALDRWYNNEKYS